MTMILAFLGAFSPENRGTLVNILLVLFVLLSYINGYFSTWFYTSFGGKHIKRVIILSGTLVPCIP